MKDKDNYYVILDESHSINDSQKSKIKEMSCEYPESKIPFTEIYRDMYWLSDKTQCEDYIETLDKDVQKLFKVKDNLHQKEGIRQKYQWLNEYLKKVCSNVEFQKNIK
ncbi:MAG: hypothetical protein QM493_06600 [Sulfurovum sp.]